MKLSSKSPTSFILLVSVFCCLLSSLSAAAELRTFKNTTGKEIIAEILEVKDSMVKLKRKDKKTFQVKIDSFSQEDQEYIKKWSKENKSYGFVINSKKKSGKIEGTDGHGHQIENKAQRYEVLVDHTSGEVLENVELRYKVFIRGEDAEMNKKSVEKLVAGEPYKLETDLTEKRLAGLWVRVYKDEKMIGEYQTNSPLVRKAEW